MRVIIFTGSLCLIIFSYDILFCVAYVAPEGSNYCNSSWKMIFGNLLLKIMNFAFWVILTHILEMNMTLLLLMITYNRDWLFYSQ